MKEFINSLTGTRMAVSDEREKEYLAAGHRPVAPVAPEAASSPTGGEPAVNGEQDTGSEAAGTESGGGEKGEAEPPAPKKSAAAPRHKTVKK